MTTIVWSESEMLEAIELPSRKVRNDTRSGLADSLEIPSFLNDSDASEVFDVVSSQAYRATRSMRSKQQTQINVTVNVDDGADYLLITRHQPSGALQFHDGTMRATDSTRRVSRSSRGNDYRMEFNAPVTITAQDMVTRGLADQVKKQVLDAIVVKIKDFVAEKTVGAAEWAIWKLLKRSQGLHKISKSANGMELTPVETMTPGSNGKTLFLIHGTFSTSRGSFGELVEGDFFEKATGIYGDAIYGFEHFTVSVSVHENATDILDVLPEGGIECDVITQSRGGLVLRNLVERSDSFAKGDRFSLGRAAMVACPNEGTPLATPDRWDNTVGWIANILDLFPPNPVTTNGALIAHWITWFVKFGVKAAEGLDSMNMTGDQIRTLQNAPALAAGRYSAITSNFTPDSTLWARALDLGMDWFFDGANDLVVPTTGGYRVDRSLAHIPPEQIGVYGPGGNLDPGETQVHHMNSFGRAQTQQFLINALRGTPQELPSFDPSLRLPTRRRSISGGLGEIMDRPKVQDAVASLSSMPTQRFQRRQIIPPSGTLAPDYQVAAQSPSSIFELTVLDPSHVDAFDLPDAGGTDDRVPLLYAAYGGARVIVPFRLKISHVPAVQDNTVLDAQFEAMAKELRQRLGRLFGYDRRVKAVLDGDKNAKPLGKEEMRAFGVELFKTLFPEDVKRLYDVARAREPDNVFIVFTSMIDWVFDFPWEFSVDPARETQLVTEDVHFVRNVLTLTPVEYTEPGRQLRMLIATAEPDGLAPLSATEETAKLLRELEPLKQAELITCDVIEGTTARNLKNKVATGKYDIVHFIGHGYWKKNPSEYGLMMEDSAGGLVELGGEDLRKLLSKRGLRLVFLNACDTGRSAREEDDDGAKKASINGVAQDLFGRGVPNVIANQFPVGDRVAVAFARGVYEYLAHGKTVAQAVREARIATRFEPRSQAMDWAVPVVYARDPKDRLVILD